jgi:hypothetical protein
MTLAAWLELITLVLKFPNAVLELARLFQKTPEEKRQEILKRVMAESDALDKEGRPKWDDYPSLP